MELVETGYKTAPGSLLIRGLHEIETSSELKHIVVLMHVGLSIFGETQDSHDESTVVL